MGRTDTSAEEVAGPDDAAGAEGATGSDRSAPSEGRDASALERALDALRSGEPICVHDAEDREGETDLCYPATAVDADALATLRTDAGGLVCVALSPAVADAAELPLFAEAVDHPAVADDPMAYGDRSSFSLTVNHRDAFTGITDEDRALTIRELGAYAGAVATGRLAGSAGGATGAGAGDPAETFAETFRVPGHVHLLRAADGLLADRRGHTELAIALAEAAGIAPAVVVCEMLDGETGGALSVSDARAYARSRGVPYLEGEQVVAALADQ